MKKNPKSFTVTIEGDIADFVLFAFRVCSAFYASKRTTNKVNEQMILQNLHAQIGVPLSKEMVRTVRAVLTQSCNQEILTIDENGYYSLI